MHLIQLKIGEKAKIVHLNNIKGVMRQRLIDFGFIEGEFVQLVRKMPFHGPVLININGQIIGIRRMQAGTIGVELT